MNKMTETEKAYIAGIVDGEGCITAYSYNTRRTTSTKSTIMVSNADTFLVDWLKTVSGLGTIHDHCNKRNLLKGWKPQRVWCLSSLHGSCLLKEILPYLIIKKEQAELFIELVELKSKSSRRGKFNEKRQNDILIRFRELNKRGLSDDTL